VNMKNSLGSFSGSVACVCAVALLLSTIQGLAQRPHQVLNHHVHPAVSFGKAALMGPLPAMQKLNLSVVLQLRNQTGLARLLGQLYNPSDPNYRHFLSVAQFTEQFGPTTEDYRSVVDFLDANGFTVTDTPANRLVVPFSGTAAQIEKAFNVRMNAYRHPTENRTFYSSDREPSLALSVPVTHIAGMDNFTMPRPVANDAERVNALASLSAIGSGPGGSYLGSDMRAAYYGGTVLTGSGQTVGLLEFGGYNISDVNLTFSSAGQSYNVPINNVLLDGVGPGPRGSDFVEVADIVQAIGMAPGLSQVRVYIGTSDVDILNKMATENIAKQIAISWVWGDNSAADDPIFQELAAQGQSVFAESGNGGSYPSSIVPLYFPAEDIYVTAVGGTNLLTNGAGGRWLSETAWSNSGGGPSPDGIPIPAYQGVVANSTSGTSMFLRNVPDVAMEANFDNYACFSGICRGGWAGTGFAASRWAGFMALVNQQSVGDGASTVGFINPTLYAIGGSSLFDSDFNDIANGSNGGYLASPGYDLVTGWGSPKGQNLINTLESGATRLEHGIINTVAGNGINGFSGDGGPAIGAELFFPMAGGVVVDTAGNLYISDNANYRIRKVTASTGTITTVVGNGRSGGSLGDDGPATNATVHSLAAVAVDVAGNLYIADFGHQRVRKVTASTGTITTLAGNGNWAYSGDGGPATSAQLASPMGVAVDASGNVYIADMDNQRIRKVTASTGIITTFAGNGTRGFSGDGALAIDAELSSPAGVAVDVAGNLYIADLFNNRIRKVTASTGIITTIAGIGGFGFSGDGGPAIDAELGMLTYPAGITVDAAGNLYIADTYNQRIRMVTASTGIITTIAGNGILGYSGDGGSATSAEMQYPESVAVNSGCYVFIVDSGNDRIRSVGGSNSPCF
jgi:sugar lactone lactonase YvrE